MQESIVFSPTECGATVSILGSAHPSGTSQSLHLSESGLADAGPEWSLAPCWVSSQQTFAEKLCASWNRKKAQLTAYRMRMTRSLEFDSRCGDFNDGCERTRTTPSFGRGWDVRLAALMPASIPI